MSDDRKKDGGGDGAFADVASFSTMPPPNDVHNASTALGPVPQALLEQLKQIAAAAPMRPDPVPSAAAEEGGTDPASARDRRLSQKPTPRAWEPPDDDLFGAPEAQPGEPEDPLGSLEGNLLPPPAPHLDLNGAVERDAQVHVAPTRPPTPLEGGATTTEADALDGQAAIPSAVATGLSTAPALSTEERESNEREELTSPSMKKTKSAKKTKTAKGASASGGSSRVIVLLLVLAALCFAAYRLVLPRLLHF